MKKLVLTIVAVIAFNLNAYSQYGFGNTFDNASETPIKIEFGVISKSPTNYTIENCNGDIVALSFRRIDITEFQINSGASYYISFGLDIERKKWLNNEITFKLGYEKADYTYKGHINFNAANIYTYNNNLSRLFLNFSYYYLVKLLNDNVNIGAGIGFMPLFPISSSEPYAGESKFINNFGFRFNPELRAAVYIQNFIFTATIGRELNLVDYFYGSEDINKIDGSPNMINTSIPYISFGLGYYFNRNKE